jgi:hypothetical protein
MVSTATPELSILTLAGAGVPRSSPRPLQAPTDDRAMASSSSFSVHISRLRVMRARSMGCSGRSTAGHVARHALTRCGLPVHPAQLVARGRRWMELTE